MPDEHQTTTKAPRHPAEEHIAFWTDEARRTADALDAARRENAELERHYRAALVQIRELQRMVRLLTQEA
jgi:hypothetical protein